MRWERLFADLEAQLAADEGRDLAFEVADRTRRERALLDLPARLLASVGATITVVTGPSTVVGRLVDVGGDWLLLEPAPGRPVLVPLTALRAARGVGVGAAATTVVGRRFGLASALRAVSRDRAVVEVLDLSGRGATGTIDVVGADHLELAEHAPDEPRRAANVHGVVLVPFTALASVRRL
ncbi:MAG TPA: hypothetical protein VFJ94_15915 [Intrasporangium sp.]|uniref:hypothetical protein n=1 Tax=Intrasporangium sp. TaxID=1925024 RepID=UPI002D7957A8|nr:hypothetical protein [Intrasporangium sp.]HET7400002.1 hypothetical protein [Intrasporangium sp.]